MKHQVRTTFFEKDKVKHEVSTTHFFGMSISSVLSTCVYLYFIMDLVVKMFFREHPLQVYEYMDRSEEDDNGDPVPNVRLLSEIGKPPVPSIYILSEFP